MKQKKIIYALTFLFLLNNHTWCVNIGSDFIVTRFNTSQTVNNGDRIAGFAALQAGFQLANSATIGNFDTFFGVSGRVRLNGGTLFLNRDLIFQDQSQFDSIGNIYGNSHVMELAPTVTIIQSNPANTPGACVIFTDLDIILNNNLELSNVCITFTGDNAIDGRGNCLTIDSTSTIIVGSNSNLRFHDITILNVNNNIIRCVDSSSTITFKDSILELSSNFSFTVGHFDILGTVEIRGDGLGFGYQSPTISTIQPESRLILDHDLTFSYAPPIANRDLIKLIDETSQLIFNGNTLFSTTTGIRLTKGDIVIKRDSFLSATGTVAGQGISFGDGTSALNNVSQRLFPAAVLEIIQGLFEYNNV